MVENSLTNKIILKKLNTTTSIQEQLLKRKMEHMLIEMLKLLTNLCVGIMV